MYYLLWFFGVFSFLSLAGFVGMLLWATSTLGKSRSDLIRKQLENEKARKERLQSRENGDDPLSNLPPGFILRELFRSKDIPFEKVREILKLTPEQMADLLHGDMPIDAEMATWLGLVTDTGRDFWVSMERWYLPRKMEMQTSISQTHQNGT